MKKLTTQIILHEYNEMGRSFRDIANEYRTYPNKIKRLFIKAGGKPRDKSMAQKTALKSGRAKHPTQGRERTATERENISEAVAKEWKNASPEQREARSEAARKQWENLSPERQEELLKMARDAARQTSKEGSRLERVLRWHLEQNGYLVDFHKDDLLENPKLQIDLFLPELSTAIEIDGPSHFEPIWGEENYMKNIQADQEKTGLLIAHGLVILRVKNTSRHVSTKMERDMVNQVLATLKKIVKSYPRRYRRLIEIEV